MVPNRIVGRVGADILQRRIADSRQSDGQLPDSSALFRLDKLSSGQIASVVKAILANPELSARVDLRIPSALVEGEGLPETVLNTQNEGAGGKPDTAQWRRHGRPVVKRGKSFIRHLNYRPGLPVL